MKKNTITILVIFFIITIFVIVLYLGNNIFVEINDNTSSLNKTPEDIQDDKNSQTVVVPKDIANVEMPNIESWVTYGSSAGFSFKYPSSFSELRNDDLFGLHEAVGNTDDITLVMPQECLNSISSFFDTNINFDTASNLNEQCVYIEVQKETKRVYNMFNSLDDSNNINTEKEKYSFSGLSGNLTRIVEKGEFGDYYIFKLMGESGDYIFQININGYGTSQEELLSIFKGVVNTFEIDNSLLTELSAFTDTDNDGIKDYKELNYGTDINLADSDGDGYSDGVEINKCYNPIGNGLMTGDFFVNFCNAEISSEIIVTTSLFNNRKELCKLWVPIAEDFINGEFPNIFLYKDWYTDYPEICENVDTLIGEESCSIVIKYLNNMCPGI